MSFNFVNSLHSAGLVNILGKEKKMKSFENLTGKGADQLNPIVRDELEKLELAVVRINEGDETLLSLLYKGGYQGWKFLRQEGHYVALTGEGCGLDPAGFSRAAEEMEGEIIRADPESRTVDQVQLFSHESVTLLRLLIDTQLDSFTTRGLSAFEGF
jgi:hypothetical protein